MMSEPYPFVDHPIKQELVDYGEYGRATGDWKPLLGQIAEPYYKKKLILTAKNWLE